MERARHFRRGASILPSLFTTGNLFLGFLSIVRTLDGRFGEAAPLIGGAVILDMLDGRIARLTHTQSEFGAQYDSLADAVSFGVAPALLAYSWALELVPRAGWPAAFLFLACGVLRLARFNVQRNVVDSRYFVGLPIPAGAAQLAAVVFVLPDARSERWEAIAMLAIVVVLGFLMVSTFRYRSFKGIDLRAPPQLHQRARHRAPVPDRGDPAGGVAARGDRPLHRCRDPRPGPSQALRRRPDPRPPLATGEPQPAP